jgi:hypothetical protein
LDISHSYAYSIHKSQGQSLDYVGVVISKVQGLNPMLVALSRHKKDMGVFLNDELKGELNDTARKKREALPEETALVKKYVEFQQIKLKEADKDIDRWSDAKTKNFIEKHGVREFFSIKKHPMDEYENLLVSSTVVEIKKTTQDYKLLETRQAEMVKQIDKNIADRGKAEAEKLTANQTFTTKEQVKVPSTDSRTAEQRRRHHAEDGQKSLFKTTGLSSIGKLSSIKSIAKEHKEALQKKVEENAKKLQEAIKDRFKQKQKKKKKAFSQ